MKVLVTGGAGFVGSHVAEFYAKKNNEVVVYDNLSRAELLGSKSPNVMYNWNFLKSNYNNITMQKADIRDKETLIDAAKDVDFIIHTAGQTAVTTSMIDPRTDFEINAAGTFNVLEAARLSNNNPAVVFCSTNKVYGDNVNNISIVERGNRYEFNDETFRTGIPESFQTDLCKHTPYGCSKFTGDIYVQDYAKNYGLKTAVFRMSCIYGPRQFGVEDQGWVAWFIIAALTGTSISIYGDGKQVRDVLHVSDLVKAYDMFLESKLKSGIFNVGGGHEKTLSLLELLDLIGNYHNKKPDIKYDDWRPSDQKVYISDISKIKNELGWEPNINVKDGVNNLAKWVGDNIQIFKD